MYKVNSIPVYERIGSFLRGCKEVQKELLRVSWSPWHSRTTPPCSCPTIGQVCPQQLWPNREAIGPLLATMPQYHIDDPSGNIMLFYSHMVGQVSYLTQEWQTNDRYGLSACLNVYFGVFIWASSFRCSGFLDEEWDWNVWPLVRAHFLPLPCRCWPGVSLIQP